MNSNINVTNSPALVEVSLKSKIFYVIRRWPVIPILILSIIIGCGEKPQDKQSRGGGGATANGSRFAAPPATAGGVSSKWRRRR